MCVDEMRLVLGAEAEVFGSGALLRASYVICAAQEGL